MSEAIRIDGCPDLSALADSLTRVPAGAPGQTALDPETRPARDTTVYTVALPAGLPLLNANRSRREHWATVRRTAKDIRNAACLVARSQRIPLIERARIVYVIHPSPQTRKRDPGNWAESAKAGVDGLVDAGIFADDNSEHVVGPDPRIGEPVKGGQLVFHIYPEGGTN